MNQIEFLDDAIKQVRELNESIMEEIKKSDALLKPYREAGAFNQYTRPEARQLEKEK